MNEKFIAFYDSCKLCQWKRTGVYHSLTATQVTGPPFHSQVCFNVIYIYMYTYELSYLVVIQYIHLNKTTTCSVPKHCLLKHCLLLLYLDVGIVWLLNREFFTYIHNVIQYPCGFFDCDCDDSWLLLSLLFCLLYNIHCTVLGKPCSF